MTTKRTDRGGMTRRDLLVLGIEAAVAAPLLAALGCDSDSGGGGSVAGDGGGSGGDAGGADAGGVDAGGVDAAGADGAGADAATEPDDGGQVVAFDPEAVPEDEALFPLGVSSGIATAASILLWGFVEGGASKTLRVWRDAPTAGDVTLVVERAVQGKDGYVKEPVEGLLPGTDYRFALFDGAAPPFAGRSAIGRFRSAIAADSLEPVTLGAASCTRYSETPYPAMGRMADQPIDFFCHLGDFSYNDEATTLEEFRAMYRGQLQEPNYRKLLTATSCYMTWDDHEIANNDVRYSLEPAHLKAAKDAYFEALPVPRREGDRFWASYRWGLTAEIFVLDCRSERKPETVDTDDPIYISKDQMAWLKQAITDSPCHFKVMMSSVPIALLNEYWPLEKDRWQGYAKQREELLNHIVDGGITNVWWLTGDFHIGSVHRVETAGPRSAMWEILAGPGGSRPNPLVLLTDNNPSTFPLVFPPEQFAYESYNTQATTTLRFDPAANTVHIRFLDGPTGDVQYDAVHTAEPA